MRLETEYHIVGAGAAGCALAWQLRQAGREVLVLELRDAPIPSGDDVLLRAGEDAWLVGDAAGLAWPTDGGGIHYALISARMLASSLLGGTPYEQAMEGELAPIAHNAAKRNSWYFYKPIIISRTGGLIARR